MFIFCLIAWRKLPAPVSLMLVTRKVAAEAWRQNEADKIRARMLRERFI